MIIIRIFVKTSIREKLSKNAECKKNFNCVSVSLSFPLQMYKNNSKTFCASPRCIKSASIDRCRMCLPTPLFPLFTVCTVCLRIYTHIIPSTLLPTTLQQKHTRRQAFIRLVFQMRYADCCPPPLPFHAAATYRNALNAQDCLGEEILGKHLLHLCT